MLASPPLRGLRDRFAHPYQTWYECAVKATTIYQQGAMLAPIRLTNAAAQLVLRTQVRRKETHPLPASSPPPPLRGSAMARPTRVTPWSWFLIYSFPPVFAPAPLSHRQRYNGQQGAIPARSLHHQARAASQPGASFCRHRLTNCANFCCELRCPSSRHNARAAYKTTRSYPRL